MALWTETWEKTTHVRRSLRTGGLLGALALGAGMTLAPAAAGASPSQGHVSGQPVGQPLASAAAANGDVNPYGIAVVPQTTGNLVAGNLLVADFNNSAGTPGSGTSVVQVDPATGTATTFASGLPISGPVGIAINPVNDLVWVGDFGSSNGSTSNDLLLLPNGTVKANFNPSTTASPVSSGQQPTFNGVWGMGVSQTSAGVSFYYGTAGSGSAGTGGGEVWRLDPHPTATSPNGQPLASTYVELATGLGDNATTKAVPVTAANAAGPEGLAFDAANGTLYVADDANNTIYAIQGASTATGPVTPIVVASGGVINTPENIVIDPNTGDLLVANAGNNTLAVIDPTTGNVLWSRVLDTGAPGALFGLAAVANAGHTTVYYDDNNTNGVYAVQLPAPRPLVAWVTKPLAEGPGTVTIRVTTNAPGPTIHLFDEYAGAHSFVQKALHVAAPEAFGNGGWTFQVSGIKATNHFYVMVNGVRSNLVAAVIG